MFYSPSHHVCGSVWKNATRGCNAANPQRLGVVPNGTPSVNDAQKFGRRAQSVNAIDHRPCRRMVSRGPATKHDLRVVAALDGEQIRAGWRQAALEPRMTPPGSVEPAEIPLVSLRTSPPVHSTISASKIAREQIDGRSLTSGQTERFWFRTFVGLDRGGSGLQNPSREQAICDGPTEPATGGNATAPPLSNKSCV